MTDFLQSVPLLALVLTFGAYQIGLWCHKKWKTPLASPIIIGALLVIGILLLTDFPNEVYQQDMKVISWLLTPATVCLALPLYEHVKVLRKNLPAILGGIAAGTVASLGFILLTCRLFGLDEIFTISLLPKSITTAMGMVLSENAGGMGSLTAAAIIVTGNLGSLIGSALCKLFRITDPVAQGVAFGTAAHVVGTSRATELGALQGAVSSLSLAVADILTAILFPAVLMLI